ncbi:type IV secretory pathway, TrbF protein [Xanthomonas citri pv. fuscans]|uniref:Type IV secretory pathway, TrbF component n=4 Tax=Xanthomonas TaxID=338 RepID=A0A2D2QK34_XANCH|nr:MULTISPECIES: conjugal transfer protein TrbF [Xanthomonas]ATS24836.1 conjugal transfer protein TrbF [Xanthomonas phaseoli pv. phaseoli]ATS28397.1 conjugal transfer protein TrbF [Xanthomonas phaseoli pv. phaseoli]ATS31818.1 conjugal transfer protein TrbF [Xanthomonas phaseoli pv. phaseoli]ATS32388.1 conjugal transfer protein TrbF [Xanthomonas phaseoli pv. phaseoli]ATS40974.1 conjugal transfer protein TrbF [Xanthomonas citri pv. phaseoli var. fuscans]
MSSTKDLLQTPVGQRPSSPPMSPHHDSARKGWTDKLEKSESDKRAWRWAAVGGYALSVLLAGGLVALSNRPPPKPLIARINTDGAPQVVGYASPNYKPGPAEIRYFLKHWVELVRTVPLDPVVVKSAWNEAYSFMTPASANKLNAEARVPGSTMSKVGQETVTTQVTSVVPVSADSYQVRWVETSFTDQGQVKERATWTSTFTIKQSTPDPKIELVNPLGLFITDFNWQRDIGSAP